MSNKRNKKEFKPWKATRGVWTMNPITRIKEDEKKKISRKICRGKEQQDD